MTGYLHVFVSHEDFELLSGQAEITDYRFGTGEAEHLFCRKCGIKSFYQPRSHPDCWSVNFHCLDQGHGWQPSPVTFDGRNWEQSAASIPQKS
ncbi:GFA family protein [Altererythrobacter arenosus]|uniref:GFA family protein n=1 Tax=Altererythrobacter arenosus TaxID=3032592 RepID=A0ABY8FW90_9SPHN|nr:GFA family protein [Altererythrobacter sp. CAU 1644]WFL78997.1 GFA family protein [Altererythrobacter sp. CAU 1644]